MKIGYWLGEFQASPHFGGVSSYTWRVLDMLLSKSNSSKLDIVILCSSEAYNYCIELIRKYNAKAEVRIIPKKFSIISRVANKFGIILSKLIVNFKSVEPNIKFFNYWYQWFSSLNIDLLYVPYQTPPSYDLPFPFIVTMHDVQELHYPEFFKPQERAWRAENYWKSLELSKAVIVSFKHVKQDLIKYFHLSDSKINICPLPYEKTSLTPHTLEQEAIYQQKYAHLKNFILYPAQAWQHKNHLALIKAAELIKEQFNRDITIVFTGNINIPFFKTIQDYIEKSVVAEQLHFLGVVPQTELYWLYKNCSLVVIPTLYEAGSFPLLEAMSLKAPVICSNVTSLPDTIGDLHFTFNPRNIEQMANLIIQNIDNIQLRTSNIQNSEQRIKQLASINSFEYFLDVFTKALL